jgi:hypothetical protein
MEVFSTGATGTFFDCSRLYGFWDAKVCLSIENTHYFVMLRRISPKASTQRKKSVADMPDACIDERQRQVRDQAYRPAYIALATIALLTVVYLGFATKFNFPLPVSFWLDSMLNGVTFIIASLPTAIVAWGEPDHE